MKKTSLLVVVLFLGFGLFSGCADEEGIMEVDVAELEARLITAPEFQQLNLLKNDVLMRLATRGVTKEQFMQITISNDEEAVRDLLGYSTEEAIYASEQFRHNIHVLKTKFPELQQFEEKVASKCGADRMEAFLDNYEVVMENLREGSSFMGKTQAVNCEYSPYTACLVLAGWTAGAAAVTGPGAIAVYGAGAYVCLCGFCEGGWVDWACL